LVATEELDALQHLSDAVIATAATWRADGTILSDTNARQVVAYAVSGRFFDLFGVPLALGRGITEADDVRGAPTVAVLSHTLWTTAYGARPDIVGTTITFSDRPVRVVGVARPTFDAPVGAAMWVSVFLPMSIGHSFGGYVRVKPGVSVRPLQPRMMAALTGLAQKYPDQEAGRAFRLTPLVDDTVGDLGPILLILFGATGLLLVLAAANVINLFLARSTGRAREMAVRAALGASRGRITAQLVGEAMLLSAAGGAAGLAGAYAAVRVLVRMGGSHLPRLDSLVFDAQVLGFVVALVIATGVGVGLVPGLKLATTDLSALMNEGGRGVRGSRQTRRLLSMFVVAEMAVAVALVAGASRLVRSYEHLERVDPGFDPRGRLVLDAVLPRSYDNPQRLEAWWQRVSVRLREADATQVAAASSLPLEHEWDSTTFVDILSQPNTPPEKRPNGRQRLVTPDFFSTMGIQLLKGRAFSPHDDTNAQSVAIVNTAFVRRFLADVDPLREQLKGFNYKMVNGQPIAQAVPIIGVVADVKYAALTAIPEPIVYVPMAQYVNLRHSIVVTSADGHPERHSVAFRAALHDVDPNMVVDIDTMSSLIAASLERQRLGMWLMIGFGVAALILATIGVLGVMAYVVAQRTGEVAIRQALGATRPQVLWLIVGEGGPAALLGIGAGSVLAWWTGRLIGRYVYDVSAADPIVLIPSAVVVAFVAMLAMLFPASRAAALDPARALRNE
jgi:putative ABC transport system permease protein